MLRDSLQNVCVPNLQVLHAMLKPWSDSVFMLSCIVFESPTICLNASKVIIFYPSNKKDERHSTLIDTLALKLANWGLFQKAGYVKHT